MGAVNEDNTGWATYTTMYQTIPRTFVRPRQQDISMRDIGRQNSAYKVQIGKSLCVYSLALNV